MDAPLNRAQSSLPALTRSGGAPPSWSYTDAAGLAGLRAEARKNDPEALQAVARQFESVFLKMMLKSMRATLPGDPIFNGQGSQLYRDLFDHQIALDLSRSQGLGISEMLVRQLLPLVKPDASTGAGNLALRSAIAPAAPPVRTDPILQRAPVAAAGPAETPIRFDTPGDFVRAVLPHAERASRKLGVPSRLLVAQAALETGWGRAIIRRPDGSSSHNLFGIKASADWTGAQVSVATLEHVDGTVRRERAAFRAYESFAEAFEDYVNFVAGNPRYAQAVAAAQEPAAYIRALHRAGYATDPDYADKVIDIMERDVLRHAGSLKIADAGPLQKAR